MIRSAVTAFLSAVTLALGGAVAEAAVWESSDQWATWHTGD